jgi:hypothetical protein
MWGEDDKDSGGYSLIDEGKYVAKITNSSLDTSKEGTEDDPYVLKVEYTISSGKFERRKLWQNFRFSEKSLKWIRWQLGVMAAFKAAEHIFKLVEMGDVHFNVEISHREYNGKTYTDTKLLDIISGPVKNQDLPSFDSSDNFDF